jgi:hypothetical protein
MRVQISILVMVIYLAPLTQLYAETADEVRARTDAEIKLLVSATELISLHEKREWFSGSKFSPVPAYKLEITTALERIDAIFKKDGAKEESERAEVEKLCTHIKELTDGIGRIVKEGAPSDEEFNRKLKDYRDTRAKGIMPKGGEGLIWGADKIASAPNSTAEEVKKAMGVPKK